MTGVDGPDAGPQRSMLTTQLRQQNSETLLARFYERYGDHAVSVARRVIYLVTGRMPGPLPV